MSIKKIEIKEKKELEPLLVANPEYLETGMKVVAHQVTTPTGPLDMLAVDDDGAW
jgi:RecB family endonuclease NucS